MLSFTKNDHDNIFPNVRSRGALLRRLGIIAGLLAALASPLRADDVPDRPVPDYDGRKPAPATVAETVLWVPRVALFPAYLATEYLVRAPIGLLGRALELNSIPFLVVDFFKFGEEDQFLFLPTVLVDFGFRSSFGFMFRWKNFLGPGNRLSIRAAYGGSNYSVLRLTDEIRIRDGSSFRASAEFSRRPDLIYQAIGPLADRMDRGRYLAEKKEAKLAYDNDAVLGAGAAFELVAREVKFADGDCCGDPGIEWRIGDGAFAAPPRYFSGYSSVGERVYLDWGRFISRPKKTAGLGGDAVVEHSFDLKGGGWVVYGGSLTGYWDVTGRSRVFSLELDARNSTPYGGAEIPFLELPNLGGNRPLGGFLSGRLLDRSSASVTLHYKWPVASILDGIAHFGLGNVFGANFDGLSLGRLRKSIGLGIEATGEKSSGFAIFAAMGSDVLERGGSFNEFRFSLRLGGG